MVLDFFLMFYLIFFVVASFGIVGTHLVPPVVIAAGGLELFRSDFELGKANLDTVVGFATFGEAKA